MIKDINDFYFTEEDFETFKPEWQTNKELWLNNRRKDVQQELLELHKQIYPKIKENGWNLWEHYNSKNITSLPYCHPRNNFRVNWLGIRYGQDPTIIKFMNQDKLPDDDGYSFLQFACIQVSVVNSGIDIALFHSIPQNSFDRGYVHDHINDLKFKTQLINIVNELKGYGIQWDCNGHTFYFDVDPAEQFPTFYEKYDEYNTYSTCHVYIPMWDIRLQKDNIVNTIMYYMELLYKLLEVVRWKKEK